MKYEVVVVYSEKFSLQSNIYKDLLSEILKRCLNEVINNEQSNNISASIN